ncbi:lytic transglycosylase domain-containing protein [Jannaschia aquimarina]|uniref:Slt_5 protein n=1 Tax=Jannaschia aquimarina TaxID=935700 RepID=A0A0D1EFS4_9RHOB|nr:lytic transglycosylase domain-containing protein [Jannaschia aquimarina]KIT16539.1 Soluble lytic murein transglycosylase precursor [Jannaschia aquimarina]SNT06184.1 Soluble lytic murein transglycosylase [Jannaschia aquimarina]
MKIKFAAAFCAVLSFGLVWSPSSADAEYTFKRVKPPSAGSRAPRIDIQITPEDIARATAPRPSIPRPPEAATPDTAPAMAATSDHQSWFWSAVSPAIGPAAGRFRNATRVAAKPPKGSGVRAPSLEHLQSIASRYGPEILRQSVGSRVSPALVLALISVESAGKADAVSHAGARGLMQLIPATAKRFGVANISDPAQNIRGGVAYLNWLMEEFDGDPVLALAGYNAGEGAVRKHAGVPPYAETRAYVPKVLAAWNVARMMCTTPPEMPGDACIFATSVASR